MKFYDVALKIRLDKETYEELKKIAYARKIKVSQLVRFLIYAELKKARKQSPQNGNPL